MNRIVLGSAIAALVVSFGLAGGAQLANHDSGGNHARRSAPCAAVAFQSAAAPSHQRVALTMAAIFELNVAVTNTRSSSPTCVVVAYGEPDRVRLHIGDQIKLHATQLMRWATHQPDSAREVVSISPDRGSDSYTLTAVRAGTLALSYSSCHGTAC